jgi:hypothetical protein
MAGRHRNQAHAAAHARSAVLVAAVIVAAVAAITLLRTNADNGCDGEVRLTVAASPEIATALRQTAQAWAAKAQGPDNRCIAVEVNGATSAAVGAAIAAAKGVTVNGLEPDAAGSAAVPDVWVPDSSTWLQRVAAAGPDLVPDEAPSVARSPVVIAMPEPVAASVGWPRRKLGWDDLLGKVSGDQPLRVGLVDPTIDATGLSGLLALGGAAAAAGSGADEATVAVMRALVIGRTQVPADLLGAFPREKTQGAIAAGLAAAPLSEQAVLAYNAREPAVRLAPLYIEPAPPDLDYPYAVLPGRSAEQVSLADGLRGALAGQAYAERLATAGLRDPAGSGDGAGFPEIPGAPATAANPAPPAQVVLRSLATWIIVTMPARMLAVIDVSGSMLTRVPTAGGATRGQVSVAAAKQGLGLFDDSWSVGVWVFSTKLDGDRDYRELLPIGPMSEQREKIDATLGQVNPIEGGETGLYDTVLAAYRTVKEGWDPRAVNSVVVLTDGQNVDPDGISLNTLVAELKKERDKERPIQVIAVGIGTDVSEKELKRITSTAGGGTFIARDPADIGEIFVKAIALRPGAPG